MRKFFHSGLCQQELLFNGKEKFVSFVANLSFSLLFQYTVAEIFALLVSDEQEKEHYGSRMISKGKKASTYTSVFLRPASYYDTFQGSVFLHRQMFVRLVIFSDFSLLFILIW